jgi:hypothetical protein
MNSISDGNAGVLAFFICDVMRPSSKNYRLPNASNVRHNDAQSP